MQSANSATTGTPSEWEDLVVDERSVGHLRDVSKLDLPPYVGAGRLVPPTVLVAQRVSSERLGIPDAPVKLNGGNRLRWCDEVAPGAVLERRSTLVDVSEKSGRSGRLVIYLIETEYRRKGSRELVGTGQSTTIRRYPHEGPPPRPERSAAVPPPELGARTAVLTVTPTSRDLVRYCAATEDFYEAHYDQRFAEAAGLPGVLVHGLLKMAYLATAALLHAGPGSAVRDLSVSYRGTDLVDEPIRVHVVPDEEPADGSTRLHLYTQSADGNISTSGTAEVVRRELLSRNAQEHTSSGRTT